MSKILLNDIEKNLDILKESFKDCYDVEFRTIELGDVKKVRLVFVFIDGLIDKSYLSEYAIASLISQEEVKSFSLEGFKKSLIKTIADKSLATVDIKEEFRMDEIIDSVLSGDSVILIENNDKCLVFDTRGWASRSIGEPQTEAVIRGPRDGFTESVKVNTTLIRRRIKDINLKAKRYVVGRRSKTTVVVMYIDDIVDKSLLKEVQERINSIDIDAVLDSSIMENLIEDNYLSAFPQIENTERPDAVAGSIYEGRIAIIVDNSPFALIVPATIGTLMQSTEDYYTRWSESSFVRILRSIAILICLLAPSMYIASTAYHPGLLPTKLAYFLAASRVNVPFPAVVEAFLMELVLELLRESGTRISGPIGTTVGIVGGLIIGQAAVEAGIVSPLMIITVALTTISSFAIPSYEFSAGIRSWRFILIFFSAVLGLYGIVLGVIILATHLIRMDSFGVPFLSPYSGLGLGDGGLKDTLVKAPIQNLEYRPVFTNPRNKRRMRRR